ncbi:hypothetical protein AYO21_06461 [Fonsecaea monophora]|uniref:Uncharacterized protein n=1 Tax=Fonsecaea monophora TaxID=254056 RepID=A0A177F4R9_9EURO|nr:hypothetical protein AYO21_06461 [Fonsecaea monophora]OAG39257.1 hypothetical protein AYO21_06461 [Fonsecaea monophora]
MADTMTSTLVEPVRASMLIDLEGASTHPKDLRPQENPRASDVMGIRIEGLDRSFAALWLGGRVIGIGSAEEQDGKSPRSKRSFVLQTLAAALLQPRLQSQDSSSVLPNVYLVTPHTSQTIPMLHVLLTKTISDCSAALELLKTVRLLQYFDLAGLAESLAEISQELYQRTHATNMSINPEAGKRTLLKDIVLIQGLGQTVSATHRRSGLVQSNALLGNLTRNITQISRISRDVLVLVEVPLEIGTVRDTQLYQETAKARRVQAAIEMKSAFAGTHGEALRLYSGHESLARTLEAALDCIVVVHDGFGRVKEVGRPNEREEQVVEVVKDRVGDLMGLWGIWKGG